MENVSQFDKQIDKWVINSISLENLTFDKLLLSLPGVYPSLVLNSINRLVSSKKVNKELLKEAMRYVKNKDKIIFEPEKSRIPHPLDFDWRFSDKTTTKL